MRAAQPRRRARGGIPPRAPLAFWGAAMGGVAGGRLSRGSMRHLSGGGITPSGLFARLRGSRFLAADGPAAVAAEPSFFVMLQYRKRSFILVCCLAYFAKRGILQ